MYVTQVQTLQSVQREKKAAAIGVVAGKWTSTNLELLLPFISSFRICKNAISTEAQGSSYVQRRRLLGELIFYHNSFTGSP